MFPPKLPIATESIDVTDLLPKSSPRISFLHALTYVPKALAWYQARPRYLLLALLPSLLSLGLSIALLVHWFTSPTPFFLGEFLGPSPEPGFFSYLWRLVISVLAVLAILLVCGLVCQFLAIPVHDYISIAVEKDFGLSPPEQTIWGNFVLAVEEVKKLLCIFLTTTLFSLIPGLLPLGLLVATTGFGWDLCDYPLVRRGWSFRKRLRFVIRHGWAMLGLGTWAWLPGFTLLASPIGVVAGTLLSLEILTKSAHDSPRKS